MCCIFILLMYVCTLNLNGESIDLQFKNTLTVIEINAGDQINYMLENGRSVKLKLISSETKILLTTLKEPKKGSSSDATIYSMECTLEIDGHHFKMIRYVPVQQSFYEPYIVNGLMIWFDGLHSLNQFFNENHGKCMPGKDARFALLDARFPICPQGITNWVDLPSQKLNVKDAYMGEDTWLGTYFGADLHGGLDINMPNNSALYAPIDFDQHFYFNSLQAGDNNNRWRGIKKWSNGDIWSLQTHHLTQLLIPEYQPIKQGQKYAYTAGTLTGSTPHTHFVFRIKQTGFEEYLLDPWVIFWQIIQNNRERTHSIKAYFAPLSPKNTGESIHFDSEGSSPGAWGNELQYSWDFGDGQALFSPGPDHIYNAPGIYPVTLVVNDGHDEHAYRQFITIDGNETVKGSVWISCEHEPSLRKSSKWKPLMYDDVPQPKNTLHFFAYFHQHKMVTKCSPKVVTICTKDFNWTDGSIGHYGVETVYGQGTEDWLNINTRANGDSLKLEIYPDVDKIKPLRGFYVGYIVLRHENPLLAPITLKTVIKLEELNTDSVLIVDDADPDCIYSDYFWLKPEFHQDWTSGYNGHFLVCNDNAGGEYVRFRLNVTDGTYNIYLHGKPYSNRMLMGKTGGFYVFIKHKNGLDKKWIEPVNNLYIGKYDLNAGEDNYVEIITDHSKDLIVVDAIRLERQNQL